MSKIPHLPIVQWVSREIIQRELGWSALRSPAGGAGQLWGVSLPDKGLRVSWAGDSEVVVAFMHPFVSLCVKPLRCRRQENTQLRPALPSWVPTEAALFLSTEHACCVNSRRLRGRMEQGRAVHSPILGRFLREDDIWSGSWSLSSRFLGAEEKRTGQHSWQGAVLCRHRQCSWDQSREEGGPGDEKHKHLSLEALGC